MKNTKTQFLIICTNFQICPLLHKEISIKFCFAYWVPKVSYLLYEVYYQPYIYAGMIKILRYFFNYFCDLSHK